MPDSLIEMKVLLAFSNCDLPDLSLPSSWDYRYGALHLIPQMQQFEKLAYSSRLSLNTELNSTSKPIHTLQSSMMFSFHQNKS
jgi:hypothetical protein